MRQLLFSAVLSVSVWACGTADPPRLALGAPAPTSRCQAWTGGRIRSDRISDSRVLAVVFTCNTCPASQLYEARIQQLHDDYRGKGVAVVAINPNQPAAMQLADLGYTDVGESLDDMKVRAAHRRLDYPYLSDGETQAVTRQFGVVIDAAHLRVRPGAHAAVSGPDRRRPARGRSVKSPDARERDRRAARGPAGSRRAAHASRAAR